MSKSLDPRALAMLLRNEAHTTRGQIHAGMLPSQQAPYVAVAEAFERLAERLTGDNWPESMIRDGDWDAPDTGMAIG